MAQNVQLKVSGIQKKFILFEKFYIEIAFTDCNLLFSLHGGGRI
jgi:hypothetical protein